MCVCECVCMHVCVCVHASLSQISAFSCLTIGTRPGHVYMCVHTHTHTKTRCCDMPILMHVHVCALHTYTHLPLGSTPIHVHGHQCKHNEIKHVHELIARLTGRWAPVLHTVQNIQL